MSDTYYTDTQSDEDQQNRVVQLSRKDIKRLEKQAKDGREALDRLAQIERERSFEKAGVPVDNPQARYFIKGYEGETTPEAIKAEWEATFGGGSAGGSSEVGMDPRINQELSAMNGANDLVSGGFDITPDKLAERDAKLAAISPSDPHGPVKFEEIMREYGSPMGNMNG